MKKYHVVLLSFILSLIILGILFGFRTIIGYLFGIVWLFIIILWLMENRGKK